MSHNPHDWSDGIPDCIIFESTADAERGAAMYRSMADALDAQEKRIRELEGALREWLDAEDRPSGVWATDLRRVNDIMKRARAALKEGE